MTATSIIARIAAAAVVIAAVFFIVSIMATPASDEAFFFPTGNYEGKPDAPPPADAIENTHDRAQTQAF